MHMKLLKNYNIGKNLMLINFKKGNKYKIKIQAFDIKYFTKTFFIFSKSIRSKAEFNTVCTSFG